MPSLFLAHGSPMIAVATEATDSYISVLHDVSLRIPKPRAILMISAHWYGPVNQVDVSLQPEMIYDFFWFPNELYQENYPCPGFPQWAELLQKYIPEMQFQPVIRWLDHGSWTVLKHLYPEAQIPVFSISIDSRNTLKEHLELWKKLRSLREEGILIIGSGNIVHNLSLIDFASHLSEPYDFAAQFDAAFQARLLEQKYEELVLPQKIDGWTLSVPSLDHYAPAITLLWTAFPNEIATPIFEWFELRSIGRRAFGFGL